MIQTMNNNISKTVVAVIGTNKNNKRRNTLIQKFLFITLLCLFHTTSLSFSHNTKYNNKKHTDIFTTRRHHVVRQQVPPLQLPPPLKRNAINNNILAVMMTSSMIMMGTLFNTPIVVNAANSNTPEVIQIDVNIPKLIQVAKENESAIINIAKQTIDTVTITKTPNNWIDFIRDAAAGDVLLNVNNNNPIDISVLSEKGAIDIGLYTNVGDASVTFASKYIPKLPLLNKRTTAISIPSTESTSSTDPKNIQERLDIAAGNILLPIPPTIPFLKQKSYFDIFDYGWTNKQVIGVTSLSLLLIYWGSYYYYELEREQEQIKAVGKKKKATAATAVKKQQQKPIQTSTSNSNTDNKQQVKDTKVTTTSSTKIMESKQERQRKFDVTVPGSKKAAVAEKGKEDKQKINIIEESYVDIPSEYYIPRYTAKIPILSLKEEEKKRKKWYQL